MGARSLPKPVSGASAIALRTVDRALRTLNRWFMVPALRLGLGAWLGSPVGGYILLLRVRGRRTGRWRETPLSYLVVDGSVWVLAGFGVRTEWYRNLLADPEVEVRLPGRWLRCRAAEADPEARVRVAPQLVRAAGLPGLLIGCNPWSAGDAQVLDRLEGIPLVRLTPEAGPIAAGPDDPGGLAWLWRQAALVAATVLLVRATGWARARRPARRGEVWFGRLTRR